MAKGKRKQRSRVKVEAGARRAAYFAAGGTAKGWSMLNGAGTHGVNKTKAARNKRACRKRVEV